MRQLKPIFGSPFTPIFSWSSERTVRIALSDAISDAAHHRVRAALESVRRQEIRGLIDATPAYTTLLLTFDPRSLDAPAAEASVRAALAGAAPVAVPRTREVVVPVCYEGDCAPDLSGVASMHGLTTDGVIQLHSSASYTAQFIGFAPGFAYLAGLPMALETPRLDRPRTRVPPGSVGIAGLQTGVYPRATPGGWRLIGRTPMRMFDAERAEPSVLVMGDRVRFKPITRAEFDAWEAKQEYVEGAEGEARRGEAPEEP